MVVCSEVLKRYWGDDLQPCIDKHCASLLQRDQSMIHSIYSLHHHHVTSPWVTGHVSINIVHLRYLLKLARGGCGSEAGGYHDNAAKPSAASDVTVILPTSSWLYYLLLWRHRISSSSYVLLLPWLHSSQNHLRPLAWVGWRWWAWPVGQGGVAIVQCATPTNSRDRGYRKIQLTPRSPYINPVLLQIVQLGFNYDLHLYPQVTS